MFYNYHKILSYNCLLNMLIGERGVGKTFGATKFVIDRFLKKGEQFVYMRRFNSELKDALPDFFSKITKECDYTNKFEIKGNRFLCDEKQMRLCYEPFYFST